MTPHSATAIRQTEVDGVPTLIAPTTGSMRAGLVFRVGRADETLARGGITHLVEHLALHRHGLTDYHFNGATGATTTHFHSRGTAEHLVAFLTGVCDGLTNLPLERLETEKAILRTEEASRSAAANELMPLWRHGARDYGLISYPEWGLSEFGPEDVRRWAATWFTRENAVLWIAGADVPAGLRLALPSGARQAPPRPSSALPSTPAYFTGQGNKVVWDAVVTRSTAAAVFSGVLERELFRALRQEGGFSYTAGTSYDPRVDGYAVVTGLADALPEMHGAVLGGFIDVLATLREGRVEQADLDAVRAKSEEALRHPEACAAQLPARATDLLTGYPGESPEQLLAELRAVTPADVRRVAVEAMESALLMAPEGHRADWAGYTPAPSQSPAAVTGRRFVARSRADVSLVVGPEGVSQVTPAGASTVWYQRCAAALSWPDGGRKLVGDDGITVAFEPTLYPVDQAATAMIDRSVHPSAIVRMPARDPRAIPRAAAPTGGRRWLELAVLIVSAGAGTLVACMGLITALALLDEGGSGGEWGVAIALFVIAALFGSPAIAIRRRRRARAAGGP